MAEYWVDPVTGKLTPKKTGADISANAMTPDLMELENKRKAEQERTESYRQLGIKGAQQYAGAAQAGILAAEQAGQAGLMDARKRAGQAMAATFGGARGMGGARAAGMRQAAGDLSTQEAMLRARTAQDVTAAREHAGMAAAHSAAFQTQAGSQYADMQQQAATYENLLRELWLVQGPSRTQKAARLRALALQFTDPTVLDRLESDAQAIEQNKPFSVPM